MTAGFGWILRLDLAHLVHGVRMVDWSHFRPGATNMSIDLNRLIVAWTARAVLGSLAVAMIAAFAATARADDEGGPKKAPEIVCALALKGEPAADTLTALEKVFGQRITMIRDDKLKLMIFKGEESTVKEVMSALRDSVEPIQRLGEVDDDDDDQPSTPRQAAIEVVRLRKLALDEATAIIHRLIVSTKLEIVPRSASNSLVFEGAAADVNAAASLARQLDGQERHSVVGKVFRLGDED
jgi:hypothetical protein